jgi:gliding motility-associated-like protein
MYLALLMKKIGIGFLFCLILFLYSPESHAQTCFIQPSSIKVCLGSSVVFTLNTTGSVAKANWDFGDGKTDTVLAGVHVYAAPGTYTTRVIVVFTNNVSCTAVINQPVRVFDLPFADFSKSNDTICLGKPLLIINTSKKSASGAPIRNVAFDFGDGTILYTDTVNHFYAQPGNYKVALEVGDTNGCISRIEKSVYVVGLDAALQFKMIDCGEMRFYNKSSIPRSMVRRFYWDLGQGTIDSSAGSYDSVDQAYTDYSKCPYTARLFLETFNGCRDTAVFTFCPLYPFNLNITGFPRKVCASKFGNVFNFSNPVNPGTTMRWRRKPLNGTHWIDSIFGPNAKYTFKGCGKYVVRLEIKANVLNDSLCIATFYDTVEVMGPLAYIERDTMPPFRVKNHFMCTPDTAYFVNPTLYQSEHCSSSIKRLWDFGDGNCPQCTTDTKKGLNVNMNCRWSVDSMNVKHHYADTGCFIARLMLWDTITGCADKDSITVTIGYPDISKIKIIGKPCHLAPQLFDFSECKPYCFPEEFWYNHDTLCPGSTWVKLDSVNRLDLIEGCQGDSVVYGFAVKNGNCYDTAYRVKHYSRLYPPFYLDKYRGCAPYTFTASLFKTLQPTCTKAVWNWGDGSSLTIDSPVANGLIKSQTHTFPSNGIYIITLTLYDTSTVQGACTFSYGMKIGVGFFMDMTVLATCKDFSVSIIDTLWMYGNPRQPGEPNKYIPWSGTRFYDFGDGTNGNTASPTHVYAKAGKYKITLIATDTFGCIDSITKTISLTEVHANFGWTPSILVCGQEVQFVDSSFVADFNGVPPRDSIISWSWDFGDLAHSIKRNPGHFYFSNGDFYVTLKVVTWRGCVDSITKKISIDGPQPSFELISDSAGCVPFTIKVRNTSKDCDLNVFHAGDPSQSSFLFKPNDTITFTYTTPGIYYLNLFGESSFVNPNNGNNEYCSSWFPDTADPFARIFRIIVYPRPKAGFTLPDTICVNTPFDITNTSDPIYHTYAWDYGDSTSDLNFRPDTNTIHTYTKTGTYNIKLTPDYTPFPDFGKCPDSASKTIVVVDLTPAFTMDTSESPLIKFTNHSVGAQSYLWDFGHPRSGSKNTSKDINPIHDYGNDSGYFVICLTAFNVYGCKDSVCQIYRNTNYKWLLIPNVFTVNSDGVNDAFDIDIHGQVLYDLTVYNRWGQAVYHSTTDGIGDDGNNWNGKFNNTGADSPEGEYYFKFNYQFREEEPKTHKGIVTLIRK